jgi:hypothetical protein
MMRANRWKLHSGIRLRFLQHGKMRQARSAGQEFLWFIFEIIVTIDLVDADRLAARLELRGLT